MARRGALVTGGAAGKPGHVPRNLRRSRLLPPLLLVVVGIAALWLLSQSRAAQLEKDIALAVMEEERALRFGAVELAVDLADPAVPHGWRRRYLASFGTVAPEAPGPQLLAVDLQGTKATTTLQYGEGPTAWQTLRAYRLIEGRWRRTSLELATPQVPVSEAVVNTLHLHGRRSDLDLVRAALQPEPQFGELRQHLLVHWPGACATCQAVLKVEPREMERTIYAGGRNELYINTPLLAQPDFRSPLPPAAQYRLAVTAGVIWSITSPSWLQEEIGVPDSRPTDSTKVASNDWLALLHLLQQTEARRWVLTESQRKSLRNSWREELGRMWHPPFDGPLPLHPEIASGKARHRWLMVALLLEHHLARGDERTIGRLSRALLAYDPDSFEADRFFSALVGGSLNDLQRLTIDYIVTSEP